MTAVRRPLTAEEASALASAATDRRARADALRWAARCEDMEAVLDDLAGAVLSCPDVTHLVGYECEGIDCRYDKGFNPTDHDVFPHLHLDAMVSRAADGSLVLAEGSEVPAAIRVADLEEDHVGIHPDSLGWQVGAPYRTAPPPGFDAEDSEVWLDAAAFRARVVHLLVPGPLSVRPLGAADGGVRRSPDGQAKGGDAARLTAGTSEAGTAVR